MSVLAYIGYYYYDVTYLLVILGAVLSMIASAQVNSTFKRYSRVRSSCGHGDCPLTCFIGHESTFYPLGKSCTEETTEYRLRCECAAKYRTKEIRDGADIQESDKQYRTAVNHRHDGYHLVCHRCDFMDTAKGKKCSAANKQNACDAVKHRCP